MSLSVTCLKTKKLHTLAGTDLYYRENILSLWIHNNNATTYGLNSFSYFSAKQWNALPDFFRVDSFCLTYLNLKLQIVNNIFFSFLDFYVLIIINIILLLLLIMLLMYIKNIFLYYFHVVSARRY